MAAKRSRLESGAFTFDLYPPGTLYLGDVDLSEKADAATYDAELKKLQEKAFALAIGSYLDGEQTVIVFEGWDAAGKGGCIRRLTTRLDPRGYKVWPIAAPRDEERRHNWLWRFWRRLPERGEIAIFDRSWYGRVLVERVEGFASKPEWQRAYGEINAFERTLTADGVQLLKFFLHIDKKTQLNRFRQRQDDPVRRYKLGQEDWRNRKRWAQYARATQDMLDRTHRPDGPWMIVPANDKKHARLQVLRAVIRLLEGKKP
jgi:polyphosphate kinase 2 (PPK2 family)